MQGKIAPNSRFETQSEYGEQSRYIICSVEAGITPPNMAHPNHYVNNIDSEKRRVTMTCGLIFPCRDGKDANAGRLRHTPLIHIPAKLNCTAVQIQR